MPSKKSRKTGKTGKSKPREQQKQLFSPFPVAPTSRRSYPTRVHPVERIAGLLPMSRTKTPAWYSAKTKTINARKEVKKLFDELADIHGVNIDFMAKTLIENQLRFRLGKSNLIDVPKMADYLERKSVTRFKGIDYSPVLPKVNLILMFINNKQLNKLIKRKKGLPRAVIIEFDRQERHLKSIMKEAKNRGMQKGK